LNQTVEFCIVGYHVVKPYAPRTPIASNLKKNMLAFSSSFCNGSFNFGFGVSLGVIDFNSLLG
jgi:hypothetical protein